MQKYESLLALFGRIGLSAIFILSGYQKLTGFSGTVAFAASAGVPFPTLAIAIAVLIELLGGLMLLFGWKTRYAALAFAVFLVPVTYYFHTNFADPTNMLMFLKNLSIFGGMLVLAAHGAGAYSVDARREA